MCMVEWLTMPWRSVSAFHHSMLIIGNTGTVCAASCDRRDLRSGAFQLAVQRQKRGGKLPVFSGAHRLQLGHVSRLDPDE